ncbi:MAG: hypothetical protein ACHREM_07080 [Polyangiales bacterium]
MSNRDVEPFTHVTSVDGLDLDLWMIVFDRAGGCTSPQTRARVLELLASGTYTDVYLFSHGWNNDWDTALGRYLHFVQGYAKLRREKQVAIGRPYVPLLIGIAWPSTSLLFPWEQPPAIAAGVPSAAVALAAEDAAAFDLMRDELRFPDAERARALIVSPLLNAEGAEELARLLSPAFAQDDGEGTPAVDPKLLAANLLASHEDDEPLDPETPFVPTEAGGNGPTAAGSFGFLDPRQLLRGVTVRTMKDRAGRVGAHGVGPLLRDVLAQCAARVHLLGHSYGARVVLSAVCGVDHPRKVDSMLLLQPAVNRMCFAAKAIADGSPGGYRPALDRVRQPIFTTFSKYDTALTKYFHLALNRAVDEGEVRIAGAPPRFGALGGYGPGGLEPEVCAQVPMTLHPDRYAPLPSHRVLALNGDCTITGHGDISNPSTWWALVNQVAVP